MQFRAWYADGEVYDGTTVDEWKALPESGVVVVVRKDDTGRKILNGGDWYYLRDDGDLHYVSSREWGSYEPKPVGCSSCIKRGVGVSDEDFWRMIGEARGY